VQAEQRRGGGVVVGEAEPAPRVEVPHAPVAAAVGRHGDEADVLREDVDGVVRRVRETDLELARQVARSVEGLLLDERPSLVPLLVGDPDLEVGAALRRELPGDPTRELGGAGVAGGIELRERRGHDVAADVAAGAERGLLAVVAVQVADERREIRPVDVVVLDALPRGHAHRAVGEALGRLVERHPLPRREGAAGRGLDADHEEVVLGLLPALAAPLLLVDAEELRDLLGGAGDRGLLASRERADLGGEGDRRVPAVAHEEEAAALDLDALVLRQRIEVGGLEREGTAVVGFPRHVASPGMGRGASGGPGSGKKHPIEIGIGHQIIQSIDV
jgi:hypothetical protein